MYEYTISRGEKKSRGFLKYLKFIILGVISKESPGKGWNINGYQSRRCSEIKKTAPMRQFSLGGTTYWYGFPIEMPGLWSSNYDTEKTGRKEFTAINQKRGKPREFITCKCIIGRRYTISSKYNLCYNIQDNASLYRRPE